jgi:hypothetical protein
MIKISVCVCVCVCVDLCACVCVCVCARANECVCMYMYFCMCDFVFSLFFACFIPIYEPYLCKNVSLGMCICLSDPAVVCSSFKLFNSLKITFKPGKQ